MPEQIAEPSEEAGETTSVPQRVKSFVKRNRKTIVGVGAAAALVGYTLLKHTAAQSIAEDSESGERPGPSHDRAVNSIVNGELVQEVFPCGCAEGEDHLEGPDSVDHEEESESYSFAGAEEIWLSSGMDEDYDFR